MEEILNRVTIITRREKKEPLRKALCDIGVKGLTVSDVEGCGVQKGEMRYYRGSQLEVRLLPKIKFELLIPEVQMEGVLKEAQSVLFTGEVGDGKIFVEEEKRVIRIRTQEEGLEAV
ncbi:P-II family nitrogen regulator [Eubacteriaceae bacterium ES2]|nr:P-II family nitrogen regulator [Eubacteriaceae bacterium ES2]